MGIGELREAFNSVSQPTFTCTLALLDYEHEHLNGKNVEWQVLLFRGTSSDGAPFEIKSVRHPGNIDLNAAARETAQQLLDQRKPAP